MREKGSALAIGVVLIAAVGCSGRAATSRTGSSVPLHFELSVDDERPDERQMAALQNLTEPPGSPTIAITTLGGHGHNGTRLISGDAGRELDEQLDSARRAATTLMREVKLSDVGYYLGSYYSAGVGTHYIDWLRVGAAFDPSKPAMLLVDTTPGHKRRLAGFSYWVRSDGPPAGFDGDGDMWHNHRGLCFVDGVMTRESVADPSDCKGDWIDGAHLWMLHAWVVPGFENSDGVFAPQNRDLCPPRRGIDAAWCDD